MVYIYSIYYYDLVFTIKLKLFSWSSLPLCFQLRNQLNPRTVIGLYSLVLSLVISIFMYSVYTEAVELLYVIHSRIPSKIPSFLDNLKRFPFLLVYLFTISPFPQVRLLLQHRPLKKLLCKKKERRGFVAPLVLQLTVPSC